MKVISTSLAGCLLIEPDVFSDERGSFFESWNAERFGDIGLPRQFAQHNVSTSTKGVLRGLHYQWPRPQGKLISVLEGAVYDVAVDLRQGSPTFGQSVGVTLSAANQLQSWIPEGFAHGFVVLTERAVFNYLCTDVYVKEADASIRWDDPTLGIEWPLEAVPLLSRKDAHAPFLAEVTPQRLPVFTA